MTSPSFQQFESDARAQGYDEVLERLWPAGAEVPNHMHPFDVSALVTQGEFWLTANGQTRHLRAGDRFELVRDVPHAERYGAEGTCVWVARRHRAEAAAA